MRTWVLMAFAGAVSATLSAKPVAVGYPDWQGVEEKNYVRGRHICAADLRQKVTAVVVFDATKAAEQLKQTILVGRAFSPCDVNTQWETENIRRDYIALYTCVGASGKDAVAAAFAKPDKELLEFGGHASIYAGVTCEGIPDASELPFLYLFGPDSKEPLLAKKFDAASLQEFRSLLRPNMAKLPKWERFYGSVGEENGFPILKKTLTAGKPLAPVLAALQKACLSSNAEKAREAQILADALEQTRSDLVCQIYYESFSKPYCAQRDLNLLLKYWPGEKTNPALTQSLKLLSKKDVAALSAIYLKTRPWTDEAFVCKNAGEAKKIVQELQKMKKTLTTLKESQTLTTQNCAFLLEPIVDSLIESIPNRLK